MSSPIRCLCKLSDCAFYTAVPDYPDQCDCTHTDKQHYMHNPCPLYRKNWAKLDGDKMKSINAIRKKRTI
ncbi:hypothetical protein IT570_06745 [Candidatus Sumerlaeota bacterium]|nr:hypothetical protein [Candidatus Sumerlaeota bacterium]